MYPGPVVLRERALLASGSLNFVYSCLAAQSTCRKKMNLEGVTFVHFSKIHIGIALGVGLWWATHCMRRIKWAGTSRRGTNNYFQLWTVAAHELDCSCGKLRKHSLSSVCFKSKRIASSTWLCALTRARGVSRSWQFWGSKETHCPWPGHTGSC